MKKLYADRLDSVEEFYFSKKYKEVQKLRDAGKHIINIAVGSPDFPPPSEAIEALKETAFKPDTHGYQATIGTQEFRESICQFYHTHFNVTLDPNSQCLPLMGSREGILFISMAFLNQGDQVLIPELGYAPYTSVAKMLEAEPIYYEMSEQTGYFPDVEALEQRDLSKVKLMWINYPHLPTGSTCTRDQYQSIVDFAKRNNIVLVNDTPYNLILNDDPISLLSIDGAKDCALELNSLSKSVNLSGWRVGMVMGRSDFIQAILRLKSNVDSGMFLGIQRGAIAALNMGPEWFKQLNETYAKRRELLYELADKLGCTYKKGLPGLYLWAKLKEGIDDQEFVDQFLYEKHLFIAPGNLFGKSGKGYIRLSLCVNEELLKEAIERV